MVEEDGDTAVGVEAEEPGFFLFVGHDVARGEGLVVCKWDGRRGEGDEGHEHEGGSPLRAINISKLFEHDLDFLAIGRALRDEMQSFGILHLVRGGIFEEVGHLGDGAVDVEVADFVNWGFGLEVGG